MSQQYIVAFDQGTTSSRAIVFDHAAHVVSMAQREFNQIYPEPGWVEHDPMEIWATQNAVFAEALAQASIRSDQVAAIGITNQRETTVIWDKNTGKPIYNAIVWQSRQSNAICEALKAQGLEDHVRRTTGLLIDPYFSASKIKWILDQVTGSRERAQRGELLFGTIDTWLIWKLSNGQVHVTDYTNASRTMLFDIHRLEWDATLLAALDIPVEMLPQVKPSSQIYGYTHVLNTQGTGIAIAGIAGDQQAALFGQMCVEAGQAKNTYGTGCFLLMNTGQHAVQSQHGLISTIACGPKGEVCYALEGTIFNAGSCVQWLRDELKVINDSFDSEYYASKVSSSNGVYVVPAFTGLGAPYWDPNARGSIFGLTRGSSIEHIIRATLESIAFQSKDVLEAMQKDAAQVLSGLRVDGGVTKNNFLMQFQADILGVPIERPALQESTALGAALLAGLATGFWQDLQDVQNHCPIERTFQPQMSADDIEKHYASWLKAVARSRHWID